MHPTQKLDSITRSGTDEFSRILRRAQAERRLPSVTASVFRGDDVVWSGTVGLADVDGAVEATPETQYRIGSITKTFTAVAIMQLRDAGKLALDDSLGVHVPESAHPQPTLRGLLTHLSGLQREPPGEIWETLRAPTREELLEQLGEAEQVLPAGSHWHYSNLAFALLGEVVERVSGSPYREYMDERLLGPVGLTRTTWAPTEPRARGYFVEPYSDTVRREPDLETWGVGAAGQLWSTTPDLCRWGRFLSDPDPAVLRPETATEMHEFQVMADPETWQLGWGLGIELFRRGDRVFGGHTGAMPGFIASLSYSRRERIGSAVLTNNGSPPPGDPTGLLLTEKAVELLLPETEPWRAGPPAPEEIAPLLGRWWSEGHEFVFRYRNGRLEAVFAGAPPSTPPAGFAPDGADRFRTVSGRERGELLRVVRDERGDVVKLYWATYPFTREPTTFG